MKILLLGEYSNVHNTLAQGLRALGHKVTVASDGDGWKDYPRDIDLKRNMSFLGTLWFLVKLLFILPRLRGYDVVQLINPVWLPLMPERIMPIYRYLRRHNKKMIMCAFGMDSYWIRVNETVKPLRYSDFNIGDTLRHDATTEHAHEEWIGNSHETICKYVANDCDAIVSGLYEYWATYNAVPELKDKNIFIPFPVKIDPPPAPPSMEGSFEEPERASRESVITPPPSDGRGQGGGSFDIFLGISRNRSAYKGTDVMLEAAKQLKEKYPDRVNLRIAEGVPFNEYQKMMDSSDCILDQLYSYTPAMNALLAMSKGIIVVGGGEEENYEILTADGIPVKGGGEQELRPIVNVVPVINEKNGTIDHDRSVQNCYKELESLILNPDCIALKKQQNIEYIRRHHDYIKVARQYEKLNSDLFSTNEIN